ncbi:pentapeptide repeat-containing protein [Cytophagaceae bacterium YF14B1]|uniref:Pentapeptide repeat-containing protein n=1 Tax=Xanthocytophaga flava TaxID=3048013 RepID=A0AAE3QV60_9BACT|nr:pentapeptide repeat-containing protein [Xanthocytophaga flavus]MDJ1483113.1 pentapeptide repeat-containing protein [Xanthocytophaga flavus]
MEKPTPWKEFKKHAKWKVYKPFLYIEWLSENFVHHLSRWSIVVLLEYVGRFTILIGLITYILEAPERERKAKEQTITKHFQAWEVINSGHGKKYSGGRKDALDILVNDKVSLLGIDLSNAIFDSLRISAADMRLADCRNIKLTNAIFDSVNLSYSKFDSAFILNSSISSSNLSFVSFKNSYFENFAFISSQQISHANFENAHLFITNLRKLSLFQSDFTNAKFQIVDLDSVEFIECNLMNVDLSAIQNWQTIKKLSYTNLYGAKFLPKGFKEFAKKKGAVFFANKQMWLDNLPSSRRFIRKRL